VCPCVTISARRAVGLLVAQLSLLARLKGQFHFSLGLSLRLEKWLLKLNIKNANSFHINSCGHRLDFKNDYYLQSEE